MSTQNPTPFRYNREQTLDAALELLLLFTIIFVIAAPLLLFVLNGFMDVWEAADDNLDRDYTSTYNRGRQEEFDSFINMYDDYRLPVAITFGMFVAFASVATVATESGLVWWLAVHNGGRGEFYDFYRRYSRSLMVFTLLQLTVGLLLFTFMIRMMDDSLIGFDGSWYALICFFPFISMAMMVGRYWYFSAMTSYRLSLSGGWAFLMVLGGSIAAGILVNIVTQPIVFVVFSLMRVLV